MPVTRRQAAQSTPSTPYTPYTPSSQPTMATETTPLVSNGHAISASPSNSPEPKDNRQLLTFDESMKAVPWQTDNKYIIYGYRQQLHTLRACFASAVSYVHNETVNIHTHFLGALVFLSLIPLHLIPTHFPFDHLATPPTLHDKISLLIYLVCAVTCLSLSSWFHTVQCHSKGMCDSAHSGDYIGIVVLIVGSILPGMYYAFHGDLVLQLVYAFAILAAGIASAYIVLSPYHRTHIWERTLTFIALGLSAVVPITHILITQGLDHARRMMSLDFIIAGGASYIFGAVLYAARIPERFSPGTFDYFGSSHQIFHVFVLLGATSQYLALRGMVWGRAMAVGHGV